MNVDEEGSEEAEASEPRQNLVTSANHFDPEYQAGVLDFGDDFASCSIVCVAEIDNQLLVAVPDTAWNKRKKSRKIEPTALIRPVAVLVPCCDQTQRDVPDPEPGTRIWLGLLKTDFEEKIRYGEGEEAMHGFPVDGAGVARLPFAEALVAIARDHFVFVTAESGGLDAPPGLGDVDLAKRVEAMESGLADIRQLLEALNQGGGATRMSQGGGTAIKAKARAKPAPAPPSVLGDGIDGMDPAVVQQALMAGVSSEALREVAAAMNLKVTPAPPAAPQADDLNRSSDEEDMLAGIPIGKGAGAADPISTAIMQKEKKVRKAKSLDAILDRAESGYAKDSASSARSKSSALLSLQKLLKTDPKMIYTSIEQRLQEDWELSALQPGQTGHTISARGWLEHRSRIQLYPSTVRAVWCLGGIWDSLRANRVEEARARVALSVVMLDQQACDAGAWVLASEVPLEPPPPMASFGLHHPPTLGELPHTRLLDPRWIDLMVAKVKDLSEYVEKKQRLTASFGKGKTDDAPPVPPVPRPKPKIKPPGKGGKDKDGKGKSDEAQAASAAA